MVSNRAECEQDFFTARNLPAGTDGLWVLMDRLGGFRAEWNFDRIDMAGQLSGAGESFMSYGYSERAERKPLAECGPPFRSERMVASREVKIRCVNDREKMRENDMRPNPKACLSVRVAACEHNQWPFRVNLPCKNPLVNNCLFCFCRFSGHQARILRRSLHHAGKVGIVRWACSQEIGTAKQKDFNSKFM